MTGIAGFIVGVVVGVVVTLLWVDELPGEEPSDEMIPPRRHR